MRHDDDQEAARQAARETALARAHARLGSPDFTEDDWLAIAEQRLGYVEPEEIPAALGRMLVDYHVHMLGWCKPDGAIYAKLAAVRDKLVARITPPAATAAPQTPAAGAELGALVLESTGPVRVVCADIGPDGCRVTMSFPARLRPITDDDHRLAFELASEIIADLPRPAEKPHPKPVDALDDPTRWLWVPHVEPGSFWRPLGSSERYEARSVADGYVTFHDGSRCRLERFDALFEAAD